MTQSHQNRIHATVTALLSASDAMIAALERLNDSAATHVPPGGGWNAAQIAYHVGATNHVIAGIITGAVPRAVAAPAEFQENPNVFSGLPQKITTLPVLEPPAHVTRADAITKLRESTGDAVSAIEGLTPEHAAGHVVDFPFGRLSLYQVAEFLPAHVRRHQAQIQRAVAGV